MVYQFGGLDRVFHALADPTRRAMLRRLSAQERTVSELAQPFRMSLAAASKHVRRSRTRASCGAPFAVAGTSAG